jgi:ABC-type transport system involved in multi-copper enzyme maturation permease subunit
MNRHNHTWGFPLLGKELTELAARRRTYIVRFLYGAVLYGGGLAILYGQSAGKIDVVNLGQGAETFAQIVTLQFAAIYVFLPAMTAGALTLEKERDTLTLLLLTTMPPWTILAQKLLSRVIPMLCFVVLSFPLMAAAYSFGGVTTASLYGTMELLVLCILQVASISLMCSSFCRTTVEAFIATYLFLGFTWLCLPSPSPFAADGTHSVGDVVARSFLMFVTTIGSLAVARACLMERAFVPPRNFLLEAFQALDRTFNEWNKSTGGVVLVRDGSPLPGDAPVAWRETAKKSLGTFRYLFRVLVVLELPILFVSQSLNINAIQNKSALSVLLYGVWGIGVALAAMHAASVVSSERSRQTLEVLLTAPIAGRDLLLQKMAGVRRLLKVLLVPFLTIYVFHHWFRDYRRDLTYLALSLGTLAAFLPLVTWLGMWFGLRLRSQMRAVFATLAGVSLIAGLPRLGEYLLRDVWRVPPGDGLRELLALGPMSIIERLESWHERRTVYRGEAEWYEVLVIGLALGGYALAAWLLRRSCLRDADRLLGRVEETPASSPLPESAALASPHSSPAAAPSVH